MRKYLINQLTQITAWIGAFIVLAEIIRLPDYMTMFFGMLLILVDDEIVKGWCEKMRPSIEAKLKDKA